MDETSITLKVGKSVLEMKDDGTVSVNGKLIQITADGDNVVIQGEDIHLN